MLLFSSAVKYPVNTLLIIVTRYPLLLYQTGSLITATTPLEGVYGVSIKGLTTKRIIKIHCISAHLNSMIR